MKYRSVLVLASLVALCLLLLPQRSPSTELTITDAPGPGVVLGVQTEAGVQYLLYSSPDTETWTPLGTPFPGTGGYMEIPVPDAQPATFYRIAKPATWNQFTWSNFTWQ